jgi:hypothetical protein
MSKDKNSAPEDVRFAVENNQAQVEMEGQTSIVFRLGYRT